jgi:hypothetical protein
MPKPPTLPGWNTRLLIHARPNEAPAVAALCGQEPVGAVFVAANSETASGAIAAMRQASDTAPVMFDANRYSGKSRKAAQNGIDRRWIETQHNLGAIWALTDSGYIADGDIDGLRSILGATRQIKDRVVAVLPLAGSWWDEGPRQALTNEIGEHGVPIALILEHPDDPFSAVRTVRGVASLLSQAPVPVMNLRSDLSGLGVLAFGGTAAAIGTASSLRHLYPVPKQGGGFGRQPQISMLWPQGLAYRTVDKLTDAIAADPDSTNWLCDCSVCYGRSLEWILNSTDLHTNSFRHSVAAIRRIADNVDNPMLTAGERQSSWLEMCRVAQAVSFEVADLSGKGWAPPKALGAWNRSLPVPVS